MYYTDCIYTMHNICSYVLHAIYVNSVRSITTTVSIGTSYICITNVTVLHTSRARKQLAIC